MKDRELKQRFDAYFEGAERPPLDLTKAKEELGRRAKRRRARIAAFSAAACAAACLLFAVLFPWNIFTEVRYSIADAVPMSESYTSVSQKYEGYAAALRPFEFSDSSTADYTIYSVDGKEALLFAEVDTFLRGIRVSAKVAIDLTDGEYDCEEYEAYDFSEGRGGYRYETVYEGGEYVFCASCTVRGAAACYVDATSASERSLAEFMQILLR